MNIKMRLGLCSLLAALGMAAACSTNDASGDRACVPGEEEPCACDAGGGDGTQTCNATGSGFHSCDCSSSGGTGGGGSGGGGTGGSGTGGGGTGGGGTGGGGTGGGGTGGGDAGGAAPDAGPEASTPDAAPGDGGLTCDLDDLSVDAGTDTPCNRCIYQNCCAQIWACSGDFCAEAGDASFTESDSMLVCLALAVSGDSGTPNPDLITPGHVTSCAATSGLIGGGPVTPATSGLVDCIVGMADGGPNCRTECVF